MTGLKPDTDHIIEIATVVTDKHLNTLAEGPVLAIHQPDAVLDAMDDWNRRQHGASGLAARVRASTSLQRRRSAQTLDFLARWIEPGVSPMCGNSICQDRRFLAREMPELERYFHYRNLDVSTLKELARRWAPEVFSGFQKSSTHLALDDIRDSIRELQHYRHDLPARAMKPHSDACERNREPDPPGTAAVVHAARHCARDRRRHRAARGALRRASAASQWQPTDREENLAGIGSWVSEAALPNLRAPVKLDVRDSEWPVQDVDYVFSANTAHIMSWPEVELMFAGVGARAAHAGRVLPCTGRSIATGSSPANRTSAFDAIAAGARSEDGDARRSGADSARPRSTGCAFTAEHCDAGEQPPAGLDEVLS